MAIEAGNSHACPTIPSEFQLLPQRLDSVRGGRSESESASDLRTFAASRARAVVAVRRYSPKHRRARRVDDQTRPPPQLPPDAGRGAIVPLLLATSLRKQSWRRGSLRSRIFEATH